MYQRSMQRVDLNKAMFWHAEASHFGGSLGKRIEEHINLKSIIALEVHNNSIQLVKGESFTTFVRKKKAYGFSYFLHRHFLTQQ